MTRRRKEEAFTVVELVFILFIAAVLIGMFIPTTGCGSREKGYRSTCSANVRQIGLALKQYALDHNDMYPTGATSTAVFTSLTNGGYLSLGSIYVCRSSTNAAWTSGAFNAAHNSYSCVASSADGSIGLSDSVSPDTPLVFDTGLEGVTNGAPLLDANGKKWSSTSAHKGAGGNICYVGGSATWKTNFDLSHDVTNGYILNP